MRYFAVLLFLISTASHAAPIAPWGWGYPSGNFVGEPKSTALEACKSFGIAYTMTSAEFDPGNFEMVINTYYIIGKLGAGALAANCRAAPDSPSAYDVKKGQWCQGVYPTGTAPNMTCPTCPTGYTDQGGVCKPPSNCPAAGTSKSSGLYLLGPNPEAAIPNVACDADCETSYSGEGVTKRVMVNGVYQYYFGLGSYSYTNQSCTGGATSPTSGSLPANSCNPTTQDTGQVNGVNVCINKTTTDTNNTTTTPTVTNADGSTTSTSTNTTTNTTNNTTTTTTTTTTTNPDGTVTKSQTSNTNPNAPQDSFCSKNPTDPSCLKNSDACKNNPETLGCSTMGTVADSILTKKEFSISSIAPVAVGNAGACPAPLTASFLGQSVEFSFDPLCKYANSLRPLVLALAWLASGLIFIGGVKN